MTKGKTLGEYIEKWHVKKSEWTGEQKLEVLGVSNVDGITTTSHVKSDDLSGYLVIEPTTFAYNPYRINVGSIGLTTNNVFGLVSPAYVVFKVQENKLIPELLLDFLKSFDGLQQINKYARGTVRKALRFDDLCKIEVNFPSYREQKNIFENKLIVEKKSDELKTEIQTQKKILAQLKQSILQEAIQGKLTADWRALRQAQEPQIEPASELLKRIKAEKNQLIKDKKIKREKVLPPITEEEIPFQLPEGWVWCRLGNLLLYSDAGKSPQCEKRPANYNEWGVLTTTAIQKGYFLEEANKVLPSNFEINLNQKVEKDDILITRAGPLNRTGISCKVDAINLNLILSDKTIRLKQVQNFISPDFIVTVLNSKSIRELLIPNMTGMAESQVNISQNNIKRTPFPLPSFEEQKAIVAKVESLMQKCQALEQEIKTSEANAQMLMQAVLKEAFEEEREVVEV